MSGEVDDTVVLEEEDVVDDIDDDEFVRCGLLRDMNIRVTSSALIEFRPPWAQSPVSHPNRGRGSKLGGDATAVIGEVSTQGVVQYSFSPALPMMIKSGRWIGSVATEPKDDLVVTRSSESINNDERAFDHALYNIKDRRNLDRVNAGRDVEAKKVEPT